MTRDLGSLCKLNYINQFPIHFFIKEQNLSCEKFCYVFFMKDYLVFGCTKLPDHSVLLVCNIMQNTGYCEFLIERNI